ncbi:DUF177 domain-containing protein [Nocardia speluncae]|uniref:DUF177 domain-containing protein n=1 Tax=Nocardia speluncae TaxID=419477 RepID=A0A846XL11_9NOCA|nr:DUF177 domain-containing protein [Nocardia speluncae]NKY35263.1 DUF177 domain-containing protein [Nocardia speluncae]
MPADTTARSRSGARRAHDAGFVLDIRSLGRAPGSMRKLRRTVTTSEQLGLDLIAVPAGSEVELDLRLQSVSEGVLVTGTVTAPVAGECSRCLEQFTDSVDVSLTELFAYPDSATDKTASDDEIYRMDDDLIDLEPLVVDQLGIELPLQPLCTPDCAGLCPECGVRMAIAGSDHGHEILDPRWAGLAKFASGSPGSGSPEGAATGDHSVDIARNSTEEK